MKKFKIAIILMILLGMPLFTTGCEVTSASISLFSAPAYNKSEEAIKKVLDKLMPANSELIAPAKQDKKRSIFVEDIDNDGSLEAFAFYHNTKENQQVHLLILKEKGGKWNKVSDFRTDYFLVDYFSLQDLDYDGKKEITIGLGTSKYEPLKQLTIYELIKGKLIKRTEQLYEYVNIGDFNSDRKFDILILDGERNKEQKAKLYSYEKGKMHLISSIMLDQYGFHENIINGKLADGKRALFVDSGLGAHSMLTEIIFYSNGKLNKIGSEADRFLFKAYPLYSSDINGDGIVEAGGMYIPKGYENSAMFEIPFIYEYADYNSNGTKKIIEERYVNGEKRFYITIRDKNRGKVTIKKFKNGVGLVDLANGKSLFNVKWIDKKYYTNNLGTKIGETNETIFYTDSKQNADTISKYFHLLQNEFN